METFRTDELNNDINLSIKKHEKIKKYFALNTFRITFLAVITTMNLIMAVFSKFILHLIPIWEFLTLEVTFFTYLIVAFSVNSFYSVILIVMCSWIRLPMLNDEWVGTLSMMISDILGLVLVMLFYNLFIIIFKIENKTKRIYVAFTVASVIAIGINALLNILWNYTFILDLYKKMFGFMVSHEFLPTYFGILFSFNVLKYTINHIIFISLLKVLIILDKKY